MVEAVEKAGVLGFYAENQVFIPQVSRARALIERGVLGQVYWVRCREAQLGQRSTWFYDPAVAGGGAMLDPGVHAVEVASYLMGKKPVSVMGWTAKLAHATPGEDNALVLMKFKESELAQAENTWVTRGGLDLRFEVHGGNGSLYITVSREAGVSMFTAGGSSRISGAGETVTEIAETKKGVVFPALGEHRTLGFVDEMRHFLAAASKGEKGMLTFQDGCSVNAIIDAAYRSAKSGGWESTKEG
jgi:predicted dehydrogenase